MGHVVYYMRLNITISCILYVWHVYTGPYIYDPVRKRMTYSESTIIMNAVHFCFWQKSVSFPPIEQLLFYISRSIGRAEETDVIHILYKMLCVLTNAKFGYLSFFLRSKAGFRKQEKDTKSIITIRPKQVKRYNKYFGLIHGRVYYVDLPRPHNIVNTCTMCRLRIYVLSHILLQKGFFVILGQGHKK